jgi:hypothetical protein
MFAKNSPFIEPFNEAINHNVVSIQRLHRKYIVSRPPSNCKKQDNRPVKLSRCSLFGD